MVALGFHRVLNEAGYRETHSQPEILIRESTFRDLVAHIVRECEAVDLQAAAPGRTSKKLKVTFTFDDGWGDNYTSAFPIARAYSIPLTIFVCPGLIGKDAPFWAERVVALTRALRPAGSYAEIKALIEHLKRRTPEKRDRYLAKLSAQARAHGLVVDASPVDRTLSWLEIAELDQAGVKFGSHTHTHEILTQVPMQTVRWEVEQSRTAIERALSKQCEAFSYPNGDWSSKTRRILVETGFKLAVTSQCSGWTTTCDHLAIPRSNIFEGKVAGLGGRFSPAMFEYTTFWKAWRAIRSNPVAAAEIHNNSQWRNIVDAE